MPFGSTARSHFLYAAVALAVLGVAARAHAQAAPRADEVARVRMLFEEGLAFVDLERWEDAEARFRECLAIRRSPVIAYNLASALEAQGALAEAALLFRAVVEQGDAPPALVYASEERLDRIEPRLAHVTVVLAGAGRDAVVAVDGAAIPMERVGARLPIEPGRHEITARDHRSEARVAIDAEPGDALEVELALRVPSAASAAALTSEREASPFADPPARTERSARERPLLWIALTTVSVGAIVGAAFLANADAEPSSQRATRGELVSIDLRR